MQDLESKLFIKFKEYMQNKSKFNPYVFNDTPKALTNFPTILMYENSNTDDVTYISLDRNEIVSDLRFVIDIYVKDMIVDGQKYTSKQIVKELKYLVFDFFEYYGFIRTEATKTDYTNYEVSRYIITETVKQNSWNNKLSN